MSRTAKLALALCVTLSAVIGAIAGQTRVDVEIPDPRGTHLRDEVEQLRARFVDVQRDLDAASTTAAATAARAKLFQLRVDMVAVEDELAVLAGRRGAAGDL